MSRIFISYRRQDADADAGRLYDMLAHEFGAERLFKDVDDVPPGVNWKNVTREVVRDSAVVLAVISPNWELSEAIQIELETAFTAGVRVIPVTVGNARMPTADALPASVTELADINAAALFHNSWGRDCLPLMEAVRKEVRIASRDLLAIECMTEEIADTIRTETGPVWRFSTEGNYCSYAGIAPVRVPPFNGRLYDALLSVARNQRNGSGRGRQFHAERVRRGSSEAEADLALARHIVRAVYRSLMAQDRRLTAGR